MAGDRSRIDPDGRYPAVGLLAAEELATRVLARLPDAQMERTRDAIQIERGGEQGIVVLVTAEAIEFRLPTIEWTGGAYGPAPTSRLWKRVKAEELDGDDGRLTELLAEAQEARVREFVQCPYCKERFPPERRDGDACHGCSERHLGIVH